MPAFSALFLVVTLSSLGLPGLNGFVGEFLILLGAFQVNRRGWPRLGHDRRHPRRGLPAVDVPARDLRASSRTRRTGRCAISRRASGRSWSPLIVLIVWIGVYPAAFTGKTEATIEALIAAGAVEGERGRPRRRRPTVRGGSGDRDAAAGRCSGRCCRSSSSPAAACSCSCSTCCRPATARPTWRSLALAGVVGALLATIAALGRDGRAFRDMVVLDELRALLRRRHLPTPPPW